MKKEDIITLPNSNLRERSKKAYPDSPETNLLIENMVEAALDWEDSRPHEISAALAAVQVDQLQRVVIVRGNFEDKSEREFTTLINPEVVKYEGEVIVDYEGCLSVKGIYGLVPRHSRVRIRALSATGEEVRFKADGFMARVLQHEIDHTNGVVFIDHIKDNTDAFFNLDQQGELKPLDYDEHIATNSILWD